MLMRLKDAIEAKRRELCRGCDGIKVVSVMDACGNLLYISEAERQQLLGDKNDIRNQSSLELCHPADREEFIKAIAKATVSRTRTTVDIRVQHADGSWLWIRGYVEPLIEDDNVSGFITMFYPVKAFDIYDLAYKLQVVGRVAPTHKKRTG